MFLIQDVDFPGNLDYKMFVLIVVVVFSINNLNPRHCYALFTIFVDGIEVTS